MILSGPLSLDFFYHPHTVHLRTTQWLKKCSLVSCLHPPFRIAIRGYTCLGVTIICHIGPFRYQRFNILKAIGVSLSRSGYPSIGKWRTDYGLAHPRRLKEPREVFRDTFLPIKVVGVYISHGSRVTNYYWTSFPSLRLPNSKPEFSVINSIGHHVIISEKLRSKRHEEVLIVVRLKSFGCINIFLREFCFRLLLPPLVSHTPETNNISFSIIFLSL